MYKEYRLHISSKPIDAYSKYGSLRSTNLEGIFDELKNHNLSEKQLRKIINHCEEVYIENNETYYLLLNVTDDGFCDLSNNEKDKLLKMLGVWVI